MLGCGEHRVCPLAGIEGAPEVLLFVRELADDVFHDHDRAIDDEAEVHRAEAHEIAGDAEVRHADDRAEEGEGDRKGDDEGRTPVSEQEQQDDDDKNGTFEEVVLHRLDGAVHEFRAVVLDGEFDAGGEAFAQGFEALIDAMRDDAAVFSGEHHHGAHAGFDAVLGRGARAWLRTNADFGEVLDQQWGDATGELDGQVLQVFHRLRTTDDADDHLAAFLVDDAAAAVVGVVGDQVGQFFEGQIDVTQFLRVGLDDELALETADGIDFSDARRASEKGLGDVFLRFIKLHQCLLFIRRFVARIGFPRQRVVEDLAEAGGDRCEPGFGAGRESVPDVLHALGDELARTVDVGSILELERDLGEAVFGEGSHLRHARQACELEFDDACDQVFRFFGGEHCDLGVDLNLWTGDVRHRVDGQFARGVEADAEEQACGEENEESLAEGEFEDAVDHGGGFVGGLDGCRKFGVGVLDGVFRFSVESAPIRPANAVAESLETRALTRPTTNPYVSKHPDSVQCRCGGIHRSFGVQRARRRSRGD